MTTLAGRWREARISRCGGISLVEIMVALAAGLLLLFGLTYVFAGSSASSRELQRAGQQVENARYATSVLIEDIRHAGYYGELYQLPAPGALPDPCTVTLAALSTSIALPIQGYNSPASTPISACLPASEFVPNTDILVMRRAQLSPLVASGDLAQNDVYIQSTGAGYEVQQGNADGFVLGTKKANGATSVLFKKDGTTAADIYKLNVHIYFVSPCSGTSCATANDRIPTLKRLEVVAGFAGPVWRISPVAEGVENFQVEYGIDDAPADPHPITGQIGDGVPDRYERLPDTVAEWQNVIAVRLHLLARQVEGTPGYADQKTYQLGTTSVSPGGSFKRHVMSTMVRINNQGGRRDS